MRVCRPSHRIFTHTILCATSMCAHRISWCCCSSLVLIVKWLSQLGGLHAPKKYILRFVLFCFTSFSPVDTCKYFLVIFVFSLWNRCEQHKSKCFERSIYYLRSFKINSQVATMKSSVWCGSVRVNGWAKQSGGWQWWKNDSKK